MTVLDLWKSGKPVREIIELTGLSKYKVWQMIGPTKGPNSRVKPENHPKSNRVLYLANWGYKPSEIAEGEGIRLKTVERILESYGK